MFYPSDQNISTVKRARFYLVGLHNKNPMGSHEAPFRICRGWITRLFKKTFRQLYCFVPGFEGCRITSAVFTPLCFLPSLSSQSYLTFSGERLPRFRFNVNAEWGAETRQKILLYVQPLTFTCKLNYYVIFLFLCSWLR